jgi:hypothetical protein
MCFFILISILARRSLFDWPITKSSECLEVPPNIQKSIYSKHKIIFRGYLATYSKSDPFLETLLKGQNAIGRRVTRDWLVCSRFSFPQHLF